MAGNDIVKFGALRAVLRDLRPEYGNTRWEAYLTGEYVRRERMYRLRRERELPEGCNDVGR
jgi:hypothetical protein